MNQIIRDFNARMALIKMSKQELADKLHKDISTINKQLDEKSSNLTFANLAMIAEALGGRILFVTPESLKAMEDSNIDAYRDRLAELGAENAALADRVEALREKIAAMDQAIDEKNRRIARQDEIILEKDKIIMRKEDIIEEKDRTIARKDAKLAQFIDRLLGEK